MLAVLLNVDVGNVTSAPQLTGSVGEIKLLGDPANETDFGRSVAIAGNTIAVGARRADFVKGTKAETDEGAAYVYSVEGNNVKFVTMLTASDAGAGEGFGYSL